MRILYGVVGEGMGHAMRSRVVLQHLLSEGHEVEIIASSRAADYLESRFEEVHRIHGLHFIAEENRVRMGRTIVSNVLEGLAALPRQLKAYFKLVEDFEPEVVISDFESWTWLYGKLHGLPTFSVDNMQALNRCTIPRELLEGERGAYEVARSFVQAKLPGCEHYFITTFFHPPIEKERTSLHAPILRPEILAAHPERGDHVLVYQTGYAGSGLERTLHESGLECRIYGMRKELRGEQVEGKLSYRAFHPEGRFLEDLVTARAVIASAGFTLMSECVYLGKPMLTIPVGNQFEQTLNGRYLEHLGYGRTLPSVTPTNLDQFIAALPLFEEQLAGYEHGGNRELFAALDHQLDRAASGLC